MSLKSKLLFLFIVLSLLPVGVTGVLSFGGAKQTNTFLFFFVLTLFFVIFAIRKFLEPLDSLSASVNRLRKGDFSARTEIISEDEVGRLAIAVNNMAARLEQLYRGLEDTVRERTKEIAEAKKVIEGKLKDVEDEKNKAQILTNELEKFKFALDGISDHVIITDPNGIALYANVALENVTGFTPEEVVGKKVWGKESAGGNMKQDFYDKLWHTIKVEKKPFVGELTNKKKNGTVYQVLASISPIVSKEGVLKFFVGIERDITRERSIDKAKSEFVSLVSHQLRTPLAAIKWYTEMLLGGDAGRLKKEQKEILDLVYESGLRMVDLVESLLDVSRLNMGTLTMDIAGVDMNAMIKSVSEEMQPMRKKKNIKFSIEYDAQIFFSADSRLLRMIFQNLISNAFKYTPPGGDVRLHLQKVPKGESFGGRTYQKDYIGITLSDTGCGIPEKDWGNIFGRFYRASNANTMDAAGSGLGLSIVKSVLDLSSGEIWFETQEGKGTTFFVALPGAGMKQKKREVF